MRPISAFRAVFVLSGALGLGSGIGCYDEEPAPPAQVPVQTGRSTVVVSSPGVASPQPTAVQPASAPPIINNVVQPAPVPAPAPTYAPAPGTTVNVQPRTNRVP